MIRKIILACFLAGVCPAGLFAQEDSARDGLSQEHGHLHHVHMNVGSIEETVAFYQRHFGVVVVNYNDNKDAPVFFMERSFLFMNEMPRDQIKNHQLTGMTHVSWSSDDAPTEYVRLKAQGVEFYTPLTPLAGNSYYMYLYGPDHEVIEIFDSQRHHRFNHIHQYAADPEVMEKWYLENVNPVLERDTLKGPAFVTLSLDNVALGIIRIGGPFSPREQGDTLEPTDGSHLDHIAFSFRDLDAAYARMRGLGTEIETPISVDEKYGFRHFFARAPNGIRVEFVEAKSWPAAAWE